MGISQQITEIGIQIHSIDYLLKCNIVGKSGNLITVSPIERRVDMFQLNEPVVVVYVEDGNLQLYSGSATSVDFINNSAEIQVVEDEVESERRIFERYPVSMSVSARRKYSSKRLEMVARNLSEYGMCATSTVELDIDEDIDLDLITGKYMFYFSGKVVWRKQLGNNFEYGFQLTSIDVSTKSALKAYLDKLKDEYRNSFFKAK